jgi:hypothetical protein
MKIIKEEIQFEESLKQNFLSIPENLVIFF